MQEDGCSHGRAKNRADVAKRIQNDTAVSRSGPSRISILYSTLTALIIIVKLDSRGLCVY